MVISATKNIQISIPWQNAEGDPGYYNRVLALLAPQDFYNWKFDLLDIIWPRYKPLVWAMQRDEHSERAVRLSRNGSRL